MESRLDAAIPLSGLPPPVPTSTLPAIPPLDGINRSAKRRKLSKKPQFWRKEATLAPPLAETSFAPGKNISSKAKQDDGSGATVVSPPMAAGPAVSIPEEQGNAPLEEENANDALPGRHVAPAKPRPQKVQKQKGQKGGKGGNMASQPVKQNGHLVWRGEDLVTGWGDPVPPQHVAPVSK